LIFFFAVFLVFDAVGFIFQIVAQYAIMASHEISRKPDIGTVDEKFGIKNIK